MPADPTALTVSPAFPAASEAETGSGLDDEVVGLFDRYREPLLRYLLSFGLAVPDGEEVIQETFLSLFLHLERGKPRHNLQGWIFRVAHNVALKRRYRDRRDGGVLSAAPAESGPVDPAPSPEVQLAYRQTQRRLLAVVHALPEQDRACLAMRAEGLRYREIAGILNMSLGAVSMSLARSLARIARSAER